MRKKENDLEMMTVRCPPIDRISNLPSNLIETILMLLPLRDAVRTSVLSKKWRYNWVKLPQLVFDDTLIKNSDWDWPFIRYLNEIELSPERRLIKVIYHVLLLHNGPILKFTLSTSQIERCSEIDLFIVFLSKNGVEEFTFGISKCQCYVLPVSFFSCSRLRHLKLSHCEFDPPRTFNGFSRLVSLEFNQVDIRESVLGSLVSSCPLLEQLTLNGSYSHFEFEDPFDFEYIEIHNAPNLKFLSISAIFGSVRFKNTPRLAVVSITSDNSDDLKLLNEKEAPEMIHVFSCLPVIETLQLGYRFVKFLTVAGVPQRLLFTLDHLKVLQLYDICFGEIVNVSFALCLIKSSPNLKRIEIEMRTCCTDDTGSVLEFLEMQDFSDVSLDQLREVHMRFISGTRPELEFIKLILAKSPLLKTIHIESDSEEVDDNEMGVWRELAQFQCVSPEAEIIYRDY